MITLIVAATDNHVIGNQNKLLWHLPNDMKFFKNTTWGMPVIMGRKTFESVNKILPGRVNIVITGQSGWKREGVITARSPEEALEKAGETNCREFFVIGGGEVYAECLGRAGKIYLTRVHTILEGDTLFPEIDESVWQLVNNLDFEADDRHQYPYSIQTWERKETSIT